MERPINLEEAKKIAFGVLKEIDDFCTKHEITYYLCYGTLIGAVRHKGFIPWDDDIDIMMPREDYDRFVALAKDGIGDHISLLYPEYNRDFFRPFARAYDSRTVLDFRNKKFHIDMGIWVDIFPLDGLPESKLKQKYHFTVQHIYRNMILANFVEQGARSSSREIVRRLLKVFVTNRVCRRLIKLTMKRSKKYSYHQSPYVAISVAAYGIRNKIRREDVAYPIKMAFEDGEFNVPNGYHNVLTSIYGDYMKLPPIEQQIAHHAYDAYWVKDTVVQEESDRKG